MQGKVIKYTKEYQRIERNLYDECTLFINNETYNVKCLWDTGASQSSVSIQLLKSLCLEQSKIITINSSAGSYESGQYHIEMAFCPELTFEVNAVSHDRGKPGCDFIIGMDIISYGKLIVDNKDNHTIVSFEYSFDPESDSVQII